jgi:hypothetical protein
MLLNRLYQERAQKRSELSTHKQNILTQLEYENEKLAFRKYLNIIWSCAEWRFSVSEIEMVNLFTFLSINIHSHDTGNYYCNITTKLEEAGSA